MCGIVGIVTKHLNGFSTKQIEAFDLLLYVDAIRGEDSTGVFCVNNMGNVTIAKEATPSGLFIPDKDYRTVRSNSLNNGWAMIGHNRKATRGTVTDENAHPFWVDDKLVLVHNGTMYGDHKKHHNVEVDSNAIAHILAEEANLNVALGKFDAAYAMVWYNVHEKRLNMARNSQRPLHYMDCEDGVYWASEWEMLEFIKNKFQLKLIEGQKIYQLAELVHQCYILQPNKSYTEEHTKIVIELPPVTTEISTYVSPEEETRYYDTWKAKWGDWDSDDVDVLPVANPVVRKIPAARADFPFQQKYNIVEYESMRSVYPSGTSIRVEVVDYAETDDKADNVYLIGKTMDKYGLFTTFPVSRKMADILTDPEMPRNKDNKLTMFNVDIDLVRWNPSAIEEYKDKMKLGMISIVGTRARLVTQPSIH